jgi:hypothetical protein
LDGFFPLLNEKTVLLPIAAKKTNILVRPTSGLGSVWFMALADPTKKLVMPITLTHVWFIANILAAYGLVGVAFTNCSQFFGQTWAMETHAK